MKYGELCRNAIENSGLAQQGQSADPEMVGKFLKYLKDLLSDWSRDGLIAPAFDSISTELVGGQNTYTMGPDGDFTRRPVEIHQAVLSGSTLAQVRVPIRVSPFDAFQANVFPTAPGQPSDAYFNPTYPLATLAVYPTPISNWTLTIYGNFSWDAITASTEVSLPPGYDSAITDNLSVRGCVNNRIAPHPLLQARALHGRNGIISALPVKDKTLDNRLASRTRNSGIRNWFTDTPTR